MSGSGTGEVDREVDEDFKDDDMVLDQIVVEECCK
jgi:hypothetical protein